MKLVFTTNSIFEIEITQKPEIKTFLLYEHISNYSMDKINNMLIIELNNDMIEV